MIGCDCDETSPNPDELCPVNQKCKQCKCIPEGRPIQKNIRTKSLAFNQSILGCDCDENSPDPDGLCPANQKCKQCKCLLEGKFCKELW